MANLIHCDTARRHDFLYLFDVTDGNPNGDPDAGGFPRVDPQTMQGLITDGCIKRKVRNWVDLTHGSEARNKIYIQDRGVALNEYHQRAYTESDIKSTGSKQKPEDVKVVRDLMCANFYDVRTFGAVMTTQVNCGQVRGPLQLTFARSIDPIFHLDMAITRVAITKVGEDKTTEIGRKRIIPYGLYLGHGYYVPHFATTTGFSNDDLELFWTAFVGAWDIDRAASRGTLALHKLYVYTHENPLGNAPAHRLFQRFTVSKKAEVQAPRCITEYDIAIDEQNLPDGITLTKLVD